ncbi:MAG: tRNA lysidine(34) synthetase TilS [Clostridiaceae bacterium]|nr:tRNA lysidine(34) synthetase TilS [Clostridiaceae bacterium]
MIMQDSVVVAGVSGGVDSMLMLAFLDYYRTQHDFFLLVCHVNHMIRGDDADLDELLVESYCVEHAIPYVSVRLDIPKLADERGVSLEQAGRDARRDTMMRLGMEYAGDSMSFRIAFAHHMDDRAESILMHVGRGSGLAGLVGIRYVDGVFIRPLLDLRLGEIESAAGILGLPWHEDETNQSDEFLRNRVRRNLIPAWRDVLGYDPVPVLVRLGDAAEGDERALAQWAEFSYREAHLPDGKLSVSSLAECPQSITKRVLARYYDDSMVKHVAEISRGFDTQHEPALTDGDVPAQPASKLSLGAAHLELLVSGIERSANGEGRETSFSLPGGIVARISDGRLFFVFPGVEKLQSDVV